MAAATRADRLLAQVLGLDPAEGHRRAVEKDSSAVVCDLRLLEVLVVLGVRPAQAVLVGPQRIHRGRLRECGRREEEAGKGTGNSGEREQGHAPREVVGVTHPRRLKATASGWTPVSGDETSGPYVSSEAPPADQAGGAQPHLTTAYFLCFATDTATSSVCVNTTRSPTFTLSRFSGIIGVISIVLPSCPVRVAVPFVLSIAEICGLGFRNLRVRPARLLARVGGRQEVPVVAVIAPGWLHPNREMIVCRRRR